jgi:hypothetical protein
MKTGLIFGYRDDQAGSRSAAFEVTKDIVSHLYPFDYIATVDSGHAVYNRAATRNLGMQQAERQGCDVVVLNDADSIPEKEPLRIAIEQSVDSGLIAHPFNEVWMLIPKVTNRIKTTPLPQLRNKVISISGPSRGGIYVCRPAVWWRTGGQDERLVGYGTEDRCHLAATTTLIGESIIIPGVLLCAYHDRQLGPTENWNYEDVLLMNRYHAAFMDPIAMTALITEEGRLG